MPRYWSSWANQHQYHYHSVSSHPSWPRALYHCSSHRRPGLFSIGRSFRTRLGLPAFFILRHSHSLTPLGKTKSLLMLIATPFINISWRYTWKHQSHRIPSPIMAQILEHYHFNNQQYELYWEWASLSPWISTLCCQVYRWVKPSEGKVGEVINKNRPPAVCFVSFVCGTLIKLSPSSSTFQTFQSVKHQHSTKLLKILMIIEKIKTLSVSVSSERRRRLTPCLLTANLPKTPLGESELLEPLFRYLPREGRGPRCKFEAFFVTGSMLVSSSPFFKPSNLLKWFQTHQTLVWSGRRWK